MATRTYLRGFWRLLCVIAENCRGNKKKHNRIIIREGAKPGENLPFRNENEWRKPEFSRSMYLMYLVLVPTFAAAAAVAAIVVLVCSTVIQFLIQSPRWPNINFGQEESA